MLHFDPAKLIPAEVIDLDNGTYEVKYKNETEENVKIWVYYQNENEDFEEIRGSPFTAEFSKTAPPKNGQMEGRSLQEYINRNLADIGKYLETTKKAVFIKEMENWEQDVDKLLEKKKNLQKINQKKDGIYLTLDMIDQTLRHLEELNQSKGKEIKRC
jgi:hypothetical protein